MRNEDNNKNDPPDALVRGVANLFIGLYRLKEWIVSLGTKSGNLVQTNYNLGCDLIDEGQFSDAIFRFKMVLRLQPNHHLACYNLGCCLMQLDNSEEAAVWFRRALGINPNMEEARFMLAMSGVKDIKENEFPQTMPPVLVRNRFESMGEDYDHIQLDLENYKAHAEMAKMLEELLEPDRNNYTMLDLGCGTGLCGPMIGHRAAVMKGVDLCSSLLDQAARRIDTNGNPAYKQLFLEDLRTFMLSRPEPEFDVIFASDVMNFIGGLKPVFDGIQKALKPGGIFAFSTQEVSFPGYHLVKEEGWFGHSEEYVRSGAEKSGLELLRKETIELYEGTPGVQYAFRRP